MEQTTLDLITAFINSTGFPIFVAVYMMVKGSKDSKEIKKAIQELTIVVKTLANQQSKGNDL